MYQLSASQAADMAQVASYVTGRRLEGEAFFFVDGDERGSLEAALSSCDELAAVFRNAQRGTAVDHATLRQLYLLLEHLQEGVERGNIEKRGIPVDLKRLMQQVSALLTGSDSERRNGPSSRVPDRASKSDGDGPMVVPAESVANLSGSVVLDVEGVDEVVLG
jgi:hypothetical protein